MVPSLIESIKVAGLVLAMNTTADKAWREPSSRGYRMPDGVDGILRRDGVFRFNETIDM